MANTLPALASNVVPLFRPAPLLIDFNLPLKSLSLRIPKNWNPVSRRTTGPPGSRMLPWDPALIHLHVEPEQMKEEGIEGNSIRLPMRRRPVWNLSLARFFLDHPEEFPESLKREGSLYCIWGDVFEMLPGHLVIVMLWYDMQLGKMVTGYRTLHMPFTSDHYSLELEE